MEAEKLKPLVDDLDDAQEALTAAEERCTRLETVVAEQGKNLESARSALEVAEREARAQRVDALLRGTGDAPRGGEHQERHRQMQAIQEEIEIAQEALARAKVERDEAAGAVSVAREALFRALDADAMAEAEAALERFVHEVMIPLERTRALLLSIGKDRKSAQWDRQQVAFKRAENGRGWKIYTGDLVSSRGVTQSHRELTDWLKGVCNEARTAKTGMRLITKSKGA